MYFSVSFGYRIGRQKENGSLNAPSEVLVKSWEEISICYQISFYVFLQLTCWVLCIPCNVFDPFLNVWGNSCIKLKLASLNLTIYTCHSYCSISKYWDFNYIDYFKIRLCELKGPSIFFKDQWTSRISLAWPMPYFVDTCGTNVGIV